MPNAHLQKSIIALAVQKKIFLVKRIFSLGPDPDWIVGQGYSSIRYILEKNHEKPTWNHEKPWETMKNYDTNLNNHETK